MKERAEKTLKNLAGETMVARAFSFPAWDLTVTYLRATLMQQHIYFMSEQQSTALTSPGSGV